MTYIIVGTDPTTRKTGVLSVPLGLRFGKPVWLHQWQVRDLAEVTARGYEAFATRVLEVVDFGVAPAGEDEVAHG